MKKKVLATIFAAGLAVAGLANVVNAVDKVGVNAAAGEYTELRKLEGTWAFETNETILSVIEDNKISIGVLQDEIAKLEKEIKQIEEDNKELEEGSENYADVQKHIGDKKELIRHAQLKIAAIEDYIKELKAELNRPGRPGAKAEEAKAPAKAGAKTLPKTSAVK